MLFDGSLTADDGVLQVECGNAWRGSSARRILCLCFNKALPVPSQRQELEGASRLFSTLHRQPSGKGISFDTRVGTVGTPTAISDTSVRIVPLIRWLLAAENFASAPR